MKQYDDCTVQTIKCKDGTVDVSWRRNRPITDEESLDALEEYEENVNDKRG